MNIEEKTNKGVTIRGLRALLAILVALSLIPFLCGCPPFPELEIENLSGQTLRFAINGTTVANLQPGSVALVEKDVASYFWHYGTIEAVAAWNDRDELVLFREVSLHEDFLETENGYRYQIPADIPESGPSSVPVFVENRTPIDILVEAGDHPESVAPGENASISVPVKTGTYGIRITDNHGDKIRYESVEFQSIAEIEQASVAIVVEIPYRDIVFRNNTDRDLTLFTESRLLGRLVPGDNIIAIPWYSQRYVSFWAYDEDKIPYPVGTITSDSGLVETHDYIFFNGLQGSDFVLEIPYSPPR